MNAKLSLLAIAAFGAISLATHPLQAQQPKTVETKSAKGRGTAADENITTPRAANNPAVEAPAPPSKGGPQTRGASCVVRVENRTPWYIDIYMDREYRGTVGPWGDLYRYVACGDTRLYGRADFTDGSYLFWGPKVDSVSGTYTWSLTKAPN